LRPRGGAEDALEVGAEARDRSRLPRVRHARAPAQRGQGGDDVAHRFRARPEVAGCDRDRTDGDQRHRVVPELVRLDGLESHADEQVGALEEVQHDAIAGHARADAGEERVVLGQQALRLRRHEGGRVHSVHEGARGGHVGARVEVEAEDHDGAARGGDGGRDLFHGRGRRRPDRPRIEIHRGTPMTADPPRAPRRWAARCGPGPCAERG
jgi:hypothetical protein